jgi:oxygen-independent coproporphyrinogen-3 oxidase
LAGLYIHIPFCKQACHYCNFHFSTSLKQKTALIEALLIELELQKDYLKQENIQSIYFGGGTPSLLSIKEIEQIFNQIHKFYQVTPDAEITLEANPDDLNLQQLKALKKTSINRLSIGIQSFFEKDLRFMNRAHSAEEATICIQNAQAIGFENLTIDLIYGIPTSTHQEWEQNIATALSFQIPHISCYCLTVEPQTALDYFVKKGKVPPVDEEKAAIQFETLMQTLKAANYEHYEISNFAKPDWHARHNSNYWRGAHYLGIGPAAHSFNGISRQWNIAHNIKYIKTLQSRELAFEKETLSIEQQYNEYILTALRTKWGCDLNKIKALGTEIEAHFRQSVKTYLSQHLILEKNNIFTLSDNGKLLADKIALELFIVV